MQTKKTKGLKPRIIKYVAMLMGICYLMNPLHEQISVVFHEVAHLIEIPDSFLNHNDIGQNIVHDVDDRLVTETSHDHLALDVIKAIFDSTKDEGIPNKLPSLKIEIDKHITAYAYRIGACHAEFKTSLFFDSIQKTTPGYLLSTKEPPKSSLG